MGLTLENNYLLLTRVDEGSSQFVAEGNDSHKYVVAVGGGFYNKGTTVYILNQLNSLDIDGVEYYVAEDSEVVAKDGE